MSDNDVLGEIAPASMAGLMVTWWQRVAGSDGHMWVAAFKRFLRKENPWPKFPTWRTVRQGTHESAKTLKEELEAEGNKLSDEVYWILKKVKIASEETEIELVVVTGPDVGLQGRYTTANLYFAAAVYGLGLCPAEVALQLRLQYEEQPQGERLLVAMKSIKDSVGYPSVFVVTTEYDGEPWLRIDAGEPGFIWNSSIRWVFARSKQ